MGAGPEWIDIPFVDCLQEMACQVTAPTFTMPMIGGDDWPWVAMARRYISD